MAQVLPLSNVIDVSTTVQATRPGFVGFGVPMIIDAENVLNTLPGTDPIVPQIRTYSLLSQMNADGFRPWNGAYRVAQTMFAQADKPAQIKVASYNQALSLQDFLTAVESADPNWYALLLSASIVNGGIATAVSNAAEWCLSVAANPHQFFFDSNEAADAGTGANNFSALKSANNNRAAGAWHLGTPGIYELRISRPFVTGNTFTGKFNSASLSVPFATDSNTTFDDVATAIAALDWVDAAVVLAGANGYNDTMLIFIDSNYPNLPMVMSDLAVTGGAAQPVATFGLTQKTIKDLTFGGNLITGNTVTVAVNGQDSVAVPFDTDNATTVADVADAIAGFDGIGYAAAISAHVIRVITLDDSARLDFTTASIAGGVSQTSIAVSAAADPIPDYPLFAGWVGECISATPGSKAWANRQLAAVSADSLSQTSYNAILGNNANCYAAFSQNAVATRIGTTASGLTIKNRLTVDAINLALQNAIFNALQSSQLVPYTDAGIQICVTAMRGVFARFQSAGSIADGWTCSGPARADVDPADVTAGILQGLTFTYTTSGEIQKAIVRGTAIV